MLLHAFSSLARRLLNHRNKGITTCQDIVCHLVFDHSILFTIMQESAISYRHVSLRFEVVAGQRVARLRLARPDNRNRIDEPMAEEIRDACRRIGEDDECRLVTITGDGDDFSVGRTALNDTGEPLSTQMARLRVADAVAGLPVPVLAELNGDATGQGLEMALAADLRIVAETASLALWEPSQPAMPWDGGTQRLPRLVGPAWALDLALTGRRITADEALRIGLVNRVAPQEELEKATRQFEEQVLSSAPIAARYAKEAVRQGMDLTLAQGLGLEADLSVILQSTADRAEGIASFEERRKPRFEGT